MTIDIGEKVKEERAKPTVCPLTPDFLIANSGKQQPDPLVPFCEIGVYLPPNWGCLSPEHGSHAIKFVHTAVTPQSHRF
jgi:hypothetical protein